MAAKWIAVIIFVWSISAIVTWIMTNQNVFASDNVTGSPNALLSFLVGTGHYDWGNFVGVGANESFFTEMWRIVTLDFPFWKDGWWVILRWLIVAPLIGTVVFGLIILFMSVFQRTV